MASITLPDIIRSPSSFAHGTITVGTTAVQGPNIKVPAGVTAAIIADSGNAGTVFIGRTSTVTTGTGFPLRSGTVVLLRVNSLNAIWFIAEHYNLRPEFPNNFGKYRVPSSMGTVEYNFEALKIHFTRH